MPPLGAGRGAVTARRSLDFRLSGSQLLDVFDLRRVGMKANLTLRHDPHPHSAMGGAV